MWCTQHKLIGFLIPLRLMRVPGKGGWGEVREMQDESKQRGKSSDVLLCNGLRVCEMHTQKNGTPWSAEAIAPKTQQTDVPSFFNVFNVVYS